MRSRAAGSVLLHHLLGLAGRRQGGAPVLARLLSISASEALSDVAEVYASKANYASIMSAKAEVAIISAAEARADVAEVYASKEEDGEWKGAETEVSAAEVKAERRQSQTAGDMRAS